MNTFRKTLIDSYYHLTRPWRWWYQRRQRRVGMSPVSILYYHRIADTHPNPWSMTCQQFEQQIDWLERNFEIVSLAEAQSRIKKRINRKPCVAITFDDGYAENCEHALPLLIKRKIPCTYFVCTANVVSGSPFPHDVKQDCPLPVNTIEQLKAISKGGIEIGAHTRTHVDLGKVRDQQQLQDEVIDATHHLEKLIDQPIRFFAFPYGMVENLNDQVFRLCKEAGFTAVCSAYGGHNLPGDDPFHLQRFHADPSLSRIRNWLTVDPKKLTTIKRYQPDYHCRLNLLPEHRLQVFAGMEN